MDFTHDFPMPGKGTHLPVLLRAEDPGGPNPWPSLQLLSLKLGSTFNILTDFTPVIGLNLFPTVG